MFSLDQIGQISIIVHDIDKSVAFYRDVLGMHFLFQAPKMAFFNCGGIRLYLGIPEGPEFDHASSVIYYSVTDLSTAHETLSTRGVHFLAPPHKVADLGDREVWMAFFKDPDENVLALMSERAKKG